MKQYVPNLIPERYRVLPDYFNESIQNDSYRLPTVGDRLRDAIAIVLLLTAFLVTGTHVGFGLSLSTVAFFASSWGQHWLEKALQFQFTPWLMTGVLGLLIGLSALTGFQYKARLYQAVQHARIAAINEQQAIVESKRKQQQRIDSLNVYLSRADTHLKKGDFPKAIRLYNQSARFLSADESDAQYRLHEGLATGYVRTKAYQSAIEQYDALARQRSLTGKQFYERAMCLQQTGRTPEAMVDLHRASEAGHKPATTLYNKQNPLLRKLLYYQTVCCDGSYSPSNAKGRGACSHHGGVCDWNKPIYETYRKYDVNGL